MRIYLSLFVFFMVCTSTFAATRKADEAPWNYTKSDGLTHHPFGLGIIVGEPTGFTAQFAFNPNVRADAGVTYSLLEYFMLYSDVSWYFTHVFRHTPQLDPLTPYVGGGSGLRFSTKSDRSHDRSTNAFIRIPLGLDWGFEKPRIHLFVELVPAMAFAPAVFALLEGGVGIRYFF